MSVDDVLAVVPVAGFEAAHAWYKRLFGRPADNLPMEGHLVEWRVTDSGWVQVTIDAGRAGSALATPARTGSPAEMARQIAPREPHRLPLKVTPGLDELSVPGRDTGPCWRPALVFR
jgi:hypothetical protein